MVRNRLFLLYQLLLMKRTLLYCLLLCSIDLLAQLPAQDEPLIGGSKFGFKVGPTMGTQRGALGNLPLLRYNAKLSIESGNTTGSGLYAQLGYHVRGSNIRAQAVDQNGNRFVFKQDYQFRNISLSVGAKGKVRELSEGKILYYAFGLRGEYTIKSNLPHFDPNSSIVPVNYGYGYYDNYVRKLNWGFDISGGIEKSFSELLTGVAELTLSPDISRQYRQLSISSTGGSAGVNEARNLSIELSVGIKFWRKVIYE